MWVEPVCWTQPQDSFPYGWDHYGVIAGDNPLGRTADTGSALKGNPGRCQVDRLGRVDWGVDKELIGEMIGESVLVPSQWVKGKTPERTRMANPRAPGSTSIRSVASGGPRALGRRRGAKGAGMEKPKAGLHEMMRERADRFRTIPRRPRVHLQAPDNRLGVRDRSLGPALGSGYPRKLVTPPNEWTSFHLITPGRRTRRSRREDGPYGVETGLAGRSPESEKGRSLESKSQRDSRNGNKGSNRCPGTRTGPNAQNPRVWREVRLLPGTSGRC